MKNKNTDEHMLQLTTDAIDNLDLAISELLTARNKGDSIGKLGKAIGLISEFQKSILERFPPDQRPLPAGDYVPAPPLTKEQMVHVDRLSEADIKKIDDTILLDASLNWRKVARLVGTAMMALNDYYPKLPDIYYAQRIRHLVEKGTLESQGDLAYMRYSEVRIPSKDKQQRHLPTTHNIYKNQ